MSPTSPRKFPNVCVVTTLAISSPYYLTPLIPPTSFLVFACKNQTSNPAIRELTNPTIKICFVSIAILSPRLKF